MADAFVGTLKFGVSLEGLASVKNQLKGLGTEAKKSTKEMAGGFSSIDSTIVGWGKDLKKFSFDFKRVAADIGTIGKNLQRVGLTVTGAFAGAFVMASKDIPAVNSALKDVKNSFQSIADSVATAALPSLKLFSSWLKDLAGRIGTFTRENSELVQVVLKLGVAILVAGVALNTFGKALRSIVSIGSIFATFLIRWKEILIGLALVVAGVAVAWLLLHKHMKAIMPILKQFFADLEGGANRATNMLGKFAEGFKSNLNTLRQAAFDFGQDVQSALEGAFSESLFQAITGRIHGLRSILMAFGEDVLRVFTKRVSNAFMGLIVGDKEGGGGLFGMLTKALGLGNLFKGGAKKDPFDQLKVKSDSLARAFQRLEINMQKFAMAKDLVIRKFNEFTQGPAGQVGQGVVNAVGSQANWGGEGVAGAAARSVQQFIEMPVGKETLSSVEKFTTLWGGAKAAILLAKGEIDNIKGAITDMMNSALIQFAITNAAMLAIGAATTIASVIIGTIAAGMLAAAWAPAALFASIATFGGAAAAGTAALAASALMLGAIVPLAGASARGGSSLFGGGANITMGGGGAEGVPQMAEGGIVRKPTLAIVGESGPEAVVPLNRGSGMGSVTINFTQPVFMEDDAAIDKFVRKISDGLIRMSNRRTGGTALVL